MTGYGAQHSRHDAALETRPIPRVAAGAVAGPPLRPGQGGMRAAMPVYRGTHGRHRAAAPPAPRPAGAPGGVGTVPPRRSVPDQRAARPMAPVYPGAPIRPQAAPAPAQPSGRPEPAAPASPGDMIMTQLGGPAGMVASVAPSLAFVVAQSAFSASLLVSIAVAVGVALAFVAFRYARGEALQPALSGVFGVLASAAVVLLTGNATDFYLIGIVASGLGFVAFLVSILMGRPLVGVTWHALTRRAPRWWTDPRVRRPFAIASWIWVVVFGARLAVQGLLYTSVHAEAWLGWARLAMGLPLTAVAAAATVWAIRRAGRALTAQPGPSAVTDLVRHDVAAARRGLTGAVSTGR